MSEIHSCSYYCTRSACVRQQRDELRDKLMKQQAEPVQEPVAWQWLDTAHFRKKIPADATPAHWRPLYTAPQPVQRKPATGAASCVPSPSFQMNAQAEPPCDHCRSPLFAALQCRVCGRKNEQTHGIKEKA